METNLEFSFMSMSFDLIDIVIMIIDVTVKINAVESTLQKRRKFPLSLFFQLEVNLLLLTLLTINYLKNGYILIVMLFLKIIKKEVKAINEFVFNINEFINFGLSIINNFFIASLK